MMMRYGKSWHCSNRSCNAVILVRAESRSEGVNPRCTCGSAMKKTYRSPVFPYLDFPSRRNSCSGRTFALQNERRIDYGDFFPSIRSCVPEGTHLTLTSGR
jgi:hypothetical protein